MPDDATKATRHTRILTKLCAFRPRFNLTWVTNGDLMQPDAGGGDWRRRIHELRERGHVIVMARDAHDQHLTRWAWLGLLHDSEAARAAREAETPGSFTPVVVRSRIDTKDGEYYRLTSSDKITVYAQVIRTAGGGQMLVEVNPRDLDPRVFYHWSKQ